VRLLSAFVLFCAIDAGTRPEVVATTYVAPHLSFAVVDGPVPIAGDVLVCRSQTELHNYTDHDDSFALLVCGSTVLRLNDIQFDAGPVDIKVERVYTPKRGPK